MPLKENNSTVDSAEHADYAGSAGDSDTLDGHDSSHFAPAAHIHSGSDITSSTVAEGYITETIARDNEIMPSVLNNDGSDSNLDADMVDGKHADEFATAIHNHDSQYYSKPEVVSLLANLQSRISQLENRVTQLENRLQGVSRSGNNILFRGRSAFIKASSSNTQFLPCAMQ